MVGEQNRMNPLQTPTAKLAAESLLGGYRPPAGVYDELLDSEGSLRPQWHQFAQLLDTLGGRELNRRWQQARKLIDEDGITYNVHGDSQEHNRRWELDALPLLMPVDQWSTLSAGLIQRAQLLNAVLADVYGSQRLLREGLLPSELVLGHPGFLRPCHGWPVPGDCRLPLYAAHLARSPDGAWWVVADRTQAPVGAGYAVENRIVISRMIPHIFHHCQVQRLAGFFITLRETMSKMAVRYRGLPHTVLLSPGPASPTYFEDSYLARYLGYTLVEGEDLTVRDHRVFLKTLGGLIDVDVVLRRVRDHDCDPLELSSQSRSGVPGLVHAARRGSVTLANALGSGLLEGPALMAFLPALCRRLLGEELKLPSVRTWWCGDSQSLGYVLANLDHLVIRTANPSDTKPAHVAQLSAAEKADVVARLRRRPERFVAQELVVRSTAPVWQDGALVPAHVALRTLAVASGESYRVMPGALAHVSATPPRLGESMFVGQGSKDVWVLSEGPVAPVTLLQPPGVPIAPRRSGNDLPSRVADNLFWLGRHVERAEGSARLMRSILNRLISESGPSQVGQLTVLFRAMDQAAGIDNEQPATPIEPQEVEATIMSHLYDPQQPGSLHSMLESLEQVATAVRDRISLDTWRILQRIDDDFYPGNPPSLISLGDVVAMLNQMILNFSAFSGVAMENMTRGPGWQFLDLGRRIERAVWLTSLLRQTLVVPDLSEHLVLEALLEIGDSSMTYRNRYATNLQVSPLLDLLMTDETNPRSVAFQLAALASGVERLPRHQAEPLLSAEQRLVMAVQSSVRLADVNALTEADDSGMRRPLNQLLEHVCEQLLELANVISHKYLVHAGPSHQLSDIHRT